MVEMEWQFEKRFIDDDVSEPKFPELLLEGKY